MVRRSWMAAGSVETTLELWASLWIAYGNTAITSRKKAAPFILVAALKKATWVNLLTRSMVRQHVELALSQTQFAVVDVDVADLCLGKAPAL